MPLTSDNNTVPNSARLFACPRQEIPILLNANWPFPRWSFPHGRLLLVMEVVPPAGKQLFLQK